LPKVKRPVCFTLSALNPALDSQITAAPPKAAPLNTPLHNHTFTFMSVREKPCPAHPFETLSICRPTCHHYGKNRLASLPLGEALGLPGCIRSGVRGTFPQQTRAQPARNTHHVTSAPSAGDVLCPSQATEKSRAGAKTYAPEFRASLQDLLVGKEPMRESQGRVSLGWEQEQGQDIWKKSGDPDHPHLKATEEKEATLLRAWLSHLPWRASPIPALKQNCPHRTVPCSEPLFCVQLWLSAISHQGSQFS
jgi:hypothetical protein